jgi:arylsulfatase
MVNAMGPYNGKPEPMEEKLSRIDDIGGPDTHSNFPWGWAMASNTPLKRYKQNTHGGGIRDPLVVSWPAGVKARGELRHQFRHACDVTPTVLESVGITPPDTIAGVTQQPIEGVSFAVSFGATDPARGAAQYFEMFGHRGLWKDGWKAVAYHAPGTDFDADKWELYHLDWDFSETEDLAAQHPEKLAELKDVPGFAVVFLPDGKPPQEGGKLKQPALANTLDHLAHHFRFGVGGNRATMLEADPVHSDDHFVGVNLPQAFDGETSRGRF